MLSGFCSMTGSEQGFGWVESMCASPMAWPYSCVTVLCIPLAVSPQLEQMNICIACACS